MSESRTEKSETVREKQIKHSLSMIKYQFARTVNQDMIKHLRNKKKVLEKELKELTKVRKNGIS